LYFGILMKRADPSSEITILERNRLDDTFGFGVVFSDATQNNLAAADAETFNALAGEFFHWDDISVHYRGHVIRSAVMDSVDCPDRSYSPIWPSAARNWACASRWGPTSRTRPSTPMLTW